jgi:hypothetical protein
MLYDKKCLGSEKDGGNISGAMANNSMVLTLPARGNFEICARHKGLVVWLGLFCRSGRGWAAHFKR